MHQLVCPDIATQPFDINGEQAWKVPQPGQFDGEAYLFAMINAFRIL